MKNVSYLFVLLFLSSILTAQKANYKVFPFKSGIVEYKLEGNSKGSHVKYFDNYGYKQADYTEAETVVFGFSTTSAISTDHHKHCEFKSRSWQGVLDTTLCDKVYQCFATGQWFSPGTPVSSTNRTDTHDITEILLKVALSTIAPNPMLHH